MPENNLLTSGVDTAMYPRFGGGGAQQQPNPLAQISQTLQVAGQAQGLQQQQLELGMKRLNYMHDQFGALVAKPNVSFDDVANVAANLVRNGMPADQIAAQLSTVPRDSAGIKAWADQHQQNVADHAARMQAGYGGQGAIGTGGTTQFYRNDVRNPSVVQPGSAIQNTMAPGVVDGPSVSTPNGPVSTKITTGQFQDLAAGKAKVGPGGTITYAGQTPGQAVPVGAPAGAAEAANVTAQASGKQFADLQKAAEGAPARAGMLANLQNDLTKFSTGPMAQATLSAKRLYNQGAGAVGMPQIDPEGVAAHENFNKQATQLAQQQFAALGGTGTDSQLGSAFKSNPNDALSTMGNKQITQMLQGNEDAIQARQTAAREWQQKNGANSYGDFQEDWNKNYSPRAFQFARMAPADRADMLKSMSPAEKANLGKALDVAEKRGWITPPK